MNTLIKQAQRTAKGIRKRKNWQRIRTFVAMFVVFVTAYSLVLPAITLDQTAADDMPGLDLMTRYVLDCHAKPHVHDESCYEEHYILDEYGNLTDRTEKVLVCGKADWLVHVHDDSCWQDGELVCPLPEIEPHEHKDECYRIERRQICTLQEHVHTDACYSDVVVGSEWIAICGYNDGEVISPAVYSDPVYDEEGNLISESELIQEETVHYHTDDCFQEVEKTELQLVCGMEEHIHDDSCYAEEKVLDCDKIELHTHTLDCYEKGPDDESPLDMGYAWYEDHDGEWVLNGDPKHLICGKTELLQHWHTDACFRTEYINDETSDYESDDIVIEEEDKEKEANTAEPQVFDASTETVAVKIIADADTFPEGTTLSVMDVDNSTAIDSAEEAVEGTAVQTNAVDIIFTDANGNRIEPENPIQIIMTPAETAVPEEETKVEVVQIDAKGDAAVVEQTENTDTENKDAVAFEADTDVTASVYVLVYTVNIIVETEINGETYTYSCDYSLIGGRSILLSELLAAACPDNEDLRIENVSSVIPGKRQTKEENNGNAKETDLSDNPEEEPEESEEGSKDEPVEEPEEENASESVSQEELDAFSEDETGLKEDINVSENSFASDNEINNEEETILEISQIEETGDYEIHARIAGEENISGRKEYITIQFNEGAIVELEMTISGIPSVDAGIAVISSADRSYLPEETTGMAEELSDEAGTNTVAIVENALETGTVITREAEEAADISKEESVFEEKQNPENETFDDTGESEVSESTETSEDDESLENAGIMAETGYEAVSETDAAGMGNPENETISNDTASNLSNTGTTNYKVFDIALNLTEEEQENYEDGFHVDLTLPSEITGRDFHLYHIHDGQTEELQIEKTGQVLDDTGLEAVTGFSFVTKNFSEFVLSYTVDFEYSVNGKIYRFKMPGGGFVSLTDLVEVLGIAEGKDNIAEKYSGNEAEITDNESETADYEEAEESGKTASAESIESNPEEPENGIKKYILDVEVSEATKKFVTDVESVNFSNPELLDISKVEYDTTVGQIKQDRELECEYSAELTEEQIEEINVQTVEAGDWTLISMHPFTSEETLTVTMKKGDSFIIRVTDAMDSSSPYDQGEIFTAYDTRPDGFTINLFDYGPESDLDHGDNNLKDKGNQYYSGINAGHDLKFTAYGKKPSEVQTNGRNVLTWNHFSGTEAATQGIVENNLSGGFPKLNGGESLSYLFDTTGDGNNKKVYRDVTGLFQKDADGKYFYNSNENYAYYNPNQGDNGYFQLSDTFPEEGSDWGVGFFPFNPWDGSKTCIHWNGYCPPRGGSNNNAGWGNDGKYHSAYYYNHHFGMTLEGSFQLTPDGKLNGKDLVFNFSGDDDLWVFIDDVLVLDIGGIHNPVGGSINFRTGDVTVNSAYPVNSVINDSQSGPAANTTIAQAFAAAGKTWNNEPYAEHTIKVFYVERGGCYSNCQMEFNLTRFKDVEFDKKDQYGDPVENAEFRLFKEDGSPLIETYVDHDDNDTVKYREYVRYSDENGYIKFDHVPVGTYYIRETDVPDGYIMDEATYTAKVIVERDEDGTYSVHSYVLRNGVQTEIVRNTKQKDITLSLDKKWRINGEVVAPGEVSAEFQLIRVKIVEEQTTVPGTKTPAVVKLLDKSGTSLCPSINVNVGDTIRVSDYLLNVDNYPWNATDTIVTASGEEIGNLHSWNEWGVKQSEGPIDYVIKESDVINGDVIIKTKEKNSSDFTTNPKLSRQSEGPDPEPVTVIVETPVTEVIETFDLPDNGSWLKTFLKPLYDEHGKEYSYYFIETTNSVGTQPVYVDNNGNIINDPSNASMSDDGTQTIYNDIPVGNLVITKELLGDVTGNEDKVFRVTIKNSSDKFLQIDMKSFGDTPCEFSVSKNTPLEIQNLPIGNYTVTEITDDGEIDITGLIWNEMESVTEGNAELEAGETKTVELKNYYNEEYTPQPADTNEYEDLNVDKDWIKADGSTEPAADDQIKIKVRVKSAEAYIPVKWDLYNGDGELNSLSGIYYVAPGSNVSFNLNRLSGVDRYHTFIRQNCNVQLYTNSGTPLWFRHKVPSSEAESTGGLGPVTPVTYTARNVQSGVHYLLQPYLGDGIWIEDQATQVGEWNFGVQVNGNKYDTVDDMKQHLIDEANESELTIENLVYTMDNNGIHLVEGETTCSIRPNADGTGMDQDTWIATLKDLPTYLMVEEGGVTKYRVYEYEVTEIEVNGTTVVDGHAGDYTVTTEENSNVTKITNKQATIDIIVRKVDDEAGSTNYLSGAVFELWYKAPGSDGSWEKASSEIIQELDADSRFEVPGDENGLTLTKLRDGSYKIVEITPPAGYVVVNKTPVLFEVSAGNIIGTEGTLEDIYTPAVEPSGESTGSLAMFTIPNTPGVPLPNAGGPGTRFFTIFGSILIAGAGLLLWRRRII